MRYSTPLWLFAMACAVPEADDQVDPPSDDDVVVDTDTDIGVDTDTDPKTVSQPKVDTTDVIDQQGTPQDYLFDDTFIHEVSIELSQASWDALLLDPATFVMGSSTVDGVHAAEVGIRLRGKLGSFRELDDKPKLKIDTNRYVSGQRLFDVKGISLNNSVADCSYLREALVFKAFREVGVLAPRVSFTHVTVNGMDYGLYQIMETQDDVYLDARYADGSGNLYDGKYISNGGWNIDTIDFTLNDQDKFELEEGVDVGHADIHVVTEGLIAYAGGEDFYGNMDPLIDWDSFHRFTAIEQWVNNWDGYALNQNNYRVYFRVDDARVVFHPFDTDLSFPSFSWSSWNNPKGEMVKRCFQDEYCRSQQQAMITPVADALALVDWTAQIDAWADLIEEEAEDDPKRSCSFSKVQSEQELLRQWMIDRPDEMFAFWGL